MGTGVLESSFRSSLEIIIIVLQDTCREVLQKLQNLKNLKNLKKLQIVCICNSYVSKGLKNTKQAPRK